MVSMSLMMDSSIDSIVTDPPYGLSFMGKKWDYDVPSVQLWEEALRVLKPGGFLLSFFGTRTYHRGVINIEDAGFEIRDQLQWLYGSGFPKNKNIGGGYGTALKPGNEPIVLARKPLSTKSVESNFAEFGTGALNIDASRIPFANDADLQSAAWGRGTDIRKGNYVGSTQSSGKTNIDANPLGRWPSNVIHDGSDEVVTLFPYSKSGKPQGMKKGGVFNAYGKYGSVPVTGYGDEGSAARFFYCAKPSKAERELGCEELAAKRYSHDGRETLIDNAYQRNGSVSGNHHPTVKPISLMRYLIKLVTPAGGTVLDPFAGSGTTLIAALAEGFNCIGIERDAEYVPIAKARCQSV
ncbi:site-specific DNA-methyltransferase [Siphonobacter sp. BAB-5385]|nr:site-specific DNA-methyltransferase [Siphonobacter sp. BAB-5385]